MGLNLEYGILNYNTYIYYYIKQLNENKTVNSLQYKMSQAHISMAFCDQEVQALTNTAIKS